jgi:hypothetical protein
MMQPLATIVGSMMILLALWVLLVIQERATIGRHPRRQRVPVQVKERLPARRRFSYRQNQGQDPNTKHFREE